MPQCHKCQMSDKQSEGAHCSRQCNQTKSVITHKLDLTTGHFVKLKTRHLRCTYSLGVITTIKCDWLLGKPMLYKKDGQMCGRYVRLTSFPTFLPSFQVEFSSQEVSFKEVQCKFLNVSLISLFDFFLSNNELSL